MTIRNIRNSRGSFCHSQKQNFSKQKNENPPASFHIFIHIHSQTEQTQKQGEKNTHKHTQHVIIYTNTNTQTERENMGLQAFGNNRKARDPNTSFASLKPLPPRDPCKASDHSQKPVTLAEPNPKLPCAIPHSRYRTPANDSLKMVSQNSLGRASFPNPYQQLIPRKHTLTNSSV